MNFSKKKLREIKHFYEMLVWVIVRNDKWKKKLPSHVKDVLNQYNLILDLIEDLEDKRVNSN